MSEAIQNTSTESSADQPGTLPPETAPQPPQIEPEWHPPELSEKKIDKTKDLPHARTFEK